MRDILLYAGLFLLGYGLKALIDQINEEKWYKTDVYPSCITEIRDIHGNMRPETYQARAGHFVNFCKRCVNLENNKNLGTICPHCFPRVPYDVVRCDHFKNKQLEAVFEAKEGKPA